MLAVSKKDIPLAVQNALSTNGKIDFADTSKIMGCINAISKKSIYNSELIIKSDPKPMKKAVAFCTKIETAKNVAEAFNELQKEGFKVYSDYVEGKMSSTERNKKLDSLRNGLNTSQSHFGQI